MTLIRPLDFMASCCQCHRIHPGWRRCHHCAGVDAGARQGATWRLSVQDATGQVVGVYGDFDQFGPAEAARGHAKHDLAPGHSARLDRVA